MNDPTVLPKEAPMTTHAGLGAVAIGDDPRAERQTESRRVVWFAGLGAAFIAFELYLFTRWFTSGNATPNRIGADEAPTYMQVAVWVHIVLGAVAFVGAIWWVVIRPLRRDGSISGDGLLMLACMTAFWGDLYANYLRIWVMYPTTWPNIGAWYNFIPGWQPDGGELIPEATVFFLPMYAVALFGCSGIAVAAMRRTQRRNPTASNIRLFLLGWLVMGLFDLVLESIWLRLGVLFYPSTIDGLTLFSGHYYQFPIYEAVLWGLGWNCVAALRFFRNDRGQTIVERGANRLRVASRRTAGIRFLALAAAVNIIILAFNLTIGFLASHGKDWPDDITSRPYMTAGLCSPEVEYACPEGEYDGDE
jgi:hypothetical protein